MSSGSCDRIGGPATVSFWWLELAALLLLSAGAVYFHIERMQHAGPLWRDEVSTLNLATQPTWGSAWNALSYDSFPMGSVAVTRLWTQCFGASDRSLRVFGLIVGMSVLAALCAVGARLARGLPLFAVSLVAWSSTTIQIGDSVRPYGLALLFALLALGAYTRWTSTASRRAFVAAMIASLCAVQCSYQNAFFILGLCVAACAASGRRDLRFLLATSVIGIVAALSLVPYAGAISSARDWSLLSTTRLSLARIGEGFVLLLTETSVFGLAAFIAASLAAAWSAQMRPRPVGEQTSDPSVAKTEGFCVACAVLVSLTCLLSLVALRVRPSTWYFLAPFAAIAVALDCLVGRSSRSRWLRMAIVLTSMITVFPEARAHCRVRRTNMDVIAKAIATDARANDLVLINPWYFGITFQRYYLGQAKWLTVPPIDDLSIHRYDLVKRRMSEADPMQSVIAAMRRTIYEGGRVWVVGGMADAQQLSAEQRRAVMPPAPHSATGWQQDPYLVHWDLQLAQFAQGSVASRTALDLKVDGPVSGLEEVGVELLRGWRETPLP